MAEVILTKLNKLTSTEREEITSICNENNIDNGGTLHSSNILNHIFQKDIILLVKNAMERVVGYLIIDTHNKDKYNYVRQMAVEKSLQGVGIGTKLLKFAIMYSETNDFVLYSEADITNIASNACHKACMMYLTGVGKNRNHYSSKPNTPTSNN
jgi:GNAT superfamily N-acetyltransferase